MTQRSTEQEGRRWGFLVAEMVLIVASILLAFALDSWWDERRERGEEQQILGGLNKEFAENRSRLEFRLEQLEGNLAALEDLVEATRSGEFRSEAITIDDAMASLMAPPTTDLGSGTLDALISSGRLEILQNLELRRLLAGWEGIFMEARDDEEFSRGFVFDIVVPYLVSEGVPVSGAFSTWGLSGDHPPRLLAEDDAARARLLADPRFATLLEARLAFKRHMEGEYVDAIAGVDAILAQIETSLAE